MDAAREKELRAQILDLETQKNAKIGEYEVILRNIREASEALTDIQERTKALQGTLIADEEAAKRIRDLQKTLFDLKEEETAKRKELSDIDILLIRKQDLLAATEARITSAKESLIDLEKSRTASSDNVAALAERVNTLQVEIAKLEDRKKYFEEDNVKLNAEYTAKMAEMRDFGARLGRAYSDLVIYESRLRREYAILFPDIPFQSPLPQPIELPK